MMRSFVAFALAAQIVGSPARVEQQAPTAGSSQAPASLKPDQQPAGAATAEQTPQSTSSTRPAFSEWLAGVRTEALAKGIRQEVIDQAFGNLDAPLPIVLDRDRAQAETVFSLEKYLARSLKPKTVEAGREMLARYKPLLTQVGDHYGVPPAIILGIWGMESNYGRFSGMRPTIAALATLAWDPRRSTFFRTELLDALEILNRGDIDAANMRGSWAGAMGQVQFMPSSYLKFAEDFDGDGRRDIWSTPGDVFASIANYLVGHGWVRGQTWGREVRVTPALARQIASTVPRQSGGCRAFHDMTEPLTLSKWRALGVRLPSGKALPAGDERASMVSGTTRHFLVNHNYEVLLEYNCALPYALSVALLGEAAGATQPAHVQPAHVRSRGAG
jgi:membrane-bound lytic murein transglycosylase B